MNGWPKDPESSRAAIADTHECPYRACTRNVSPQYLACRAHWMKVSPSTRARVYATFASGDHGAYLDARHQAIEEMNAR